MTSMHRVLKPAQSLDENTVLVGKKLTTQQSSNAVAPTKRAALGDVTNSLQNMDVKKTTKQPLSVQSSTAQVSAPTQRVLVTQSSIPSRQQAPKVDLSRQMASLHVTREEMEVETPQLSSYGIEDIDTEDMEDPAFCVDYVHDIMKYLRKREKEDFIGSNLFAHQTDLEPRNRQALVEWLCEIAVNFQLTNETLFLTVNVIDRYLSKKRVSKSIFQAVGVTAMLVACKMEEIYAPELRDFVYITDNSTSEAQIRELELLILDTLDYKLTSPTAIHFLRRFSKASKSDPPMHTFCKYVIELALTDLRMCNYLPSTVAASAVYIARKIAAFPETWNKTMEYYTGYSEAMLQPSIRDLSDILRAQKLAPGPIFKKYSHQSLFGVSRTTIPNTW